MAFYHDCGFRLKRRNHWQELGLANRAHSTQSGGSLCQPNLREAYLKSDRIFCDMAEAWTSIAVADRVSIWFLAKSAASAAKSVSSIFDIDTLHAADTKLHSCLFSGSGAIAKIVQSACRSIEF